MKHGGVEWVNGKPENINDFSVNLNPLGTPEFIKELVYDAVRSSVYSYYPGSLRPIKELISEVYNVDVGLIGVFNGSSEVFPLLPPCDVPEPNFSEYKRRRSYLAKEGSDEFIYHLEGDCVITSNPVNPTGSYIKKEDVTSFLERGGKLFLDESFVDISLIESSTSLAEEFKNVLIISSFTKSLAIPGLRLGFTIGSLSEELERRVQPWRVNSITYYVFSNVSPKDIKGFFKKSKEYVKELHELLDKVPSRYKKYKSVAPFVLFEFPIHVIELNKELRRRGFQIRDPEGFIGLRPTHGRVSLKGDINTLIEIINEIIWNSNDKLY